VNGGSGDATPYNSFGSRFYTRRFLRITGFKFTPQVGGIINLEY